MATKSEIADIEKNLTKGQLRKLNALRKSVGPAIGERAFVEWLKKANVGKDERARAQGKQLGRPRVGWMIETRIRKLRAMGFGIQRTAKKAGCGVSVVQRVIAAE